MNTNSARTPLIARAVEDPVLNREVGFTVAQREALDNPSQAVQDATWQPACAAKVFVMSALGSVSGRRVRRIKHLPLRALPPSAEVRTAAADSVLLAVACLVSYLLTTRVLSLVYSVSKDDDALGGMWAVIATVFLFRDSYNKSLAGAVSRMSATLVSFVLCLAYLSFLPFSPVGLAILVGLSVLVTVLIGRPEDEITAGITTTVVLVAASLSPHDAWRQPILRLADTTIGVAVGLAAAWLGLRAIGPRIRPSESSSATR